MLLLIVDVSKHGVAKSRQESTVKDIATDPVVNCQFMSSTSIFQFKIANIDFPALLGCQKLLVKNKNVGGGIVT